MKSVKRAAAAVTAAVLTAGCGAFGAFADDTTEYNIWVGGVQVTNENLSDVLADGGSVRYDPELSVLYLEYPDIKGDHNGAKIYAEGAPLTVSGKVLLSADGVEKTVIWSEDDLDLKDAMFTADGFCDGYVSENDSLTLNNSLAIFKRSGTYPAHGGLLSGGDISVTNSLIRITGYEAPVSCPGGYISIEGPDTEVFLNDPKGDPMIYGGIAFSGDIFPTYSDNIAVSPEGITVTEESEDTFLKIAPAEGIRVIRGECIGKGDISMERQWYAPGTRVKIGLTPDEGWELSSVKLTDGEGAEIELDDDGFFTVPASDIFILAEFTEIHRHAPEYVEEIAATCDEEGRMGYYLCSCGKMFEDEAGTVEITDPDILAVPALGHDWDEGVIIKEPTESEVGKKLYTCQRDRSHSFTVDVPYPEQDESSVPDETSADEESSSALESSSEAASSKSAESKNDSKSAGSSQGSNPKTGIAAGFAAFTLAGAAVLAVKKRR